MHVRRKKQDPFVCGAKSNGFAKIEDIFPTKSDNKDDEHLNLTLFEDSMIDAETGEPIKLSKARWNVKEGRLNLDTATILAMGTGRMDIKNRVHYEEIITTTPVNNSSKSYIKNVSPISRVPSTTHLKLTPLNSSNNIRQHTWDGMFSTVSRASTAQSANITLQQGDNQPITSMNINAAIESPLSPLSLGSPDPHICRAPTGHKRHPLITKFLKAGPLKPIHHIHWDARSNLVLTQDEEGNPIDMAEEGVDYGSDEADSKKALMLEGCPAAPFSQSQINGNVSILPSGSSSVHSSYSGLSASTGSKAPHRKRGKAKKYTGSGGTSSVNSAASAATKRIGCSSLSLEPADDPTVGLVDDAIVMSNKQNWQAVEERVFQELFSIAWAYERNKSLTGEPRAAGGLAGVRQQARSIARLKVRAMRELVQASADEKIKEAKRTELEAESASRACHLAELQRAHEEERKKARRYLHALEHDNEIILIRKLSELGWLW